MYKLFLLILLFATVAGVASAQQPIVGQPCGAAGLSAISTSGQAVQCQGSPLTWVATGGGNGGGGTVTSIGISTSSLSVSGSPVTNSGNITVDVPAINLAATGNGGITGNLPIANLNGGVNASASTVWCGNGAWCTPASTGTINTAPQFSLPYYSLSGSNSTLSGVSPPTTVGVWTPMFNVVTPGTAVIPTIGLSGALPRDVTGAVSTDTIVFGDCSNWVNYYGSVAVATSLPTPTTLNNSNCIFHVMNMTSGAATAVTFTATTFNFKSTGTTTRVIQQGQVCTFDADNANSLWGDDCHDLPLTAGIGITITRGQFGSTIASSTATVALSAITAATASNTIANANNPQTWNWTQTTANQNALTIGDTSAATGGTINANGTATQGLLAATTASNSTEAPLSVTLGSQTGTTGPPTAQFFATWNNASLVGKGLILSVTNTASSGTSHFIDLLGGAAGATNQFFVDSAGNVVSNGLYKSASSLYQATLPTTGSTFQGGNDSGGTVAGPGTFRGGNNTTNSAGAAGGGAVLAGGTETGATAATIGGYAFVISGPTTSTAGVPGTLEVAQSMFGSALTLDTAVCMTSTAWTVGTCTTTSTNWGAFIGIALATGTPVPVVQHGVAPVVATAAVTIGHTACLSATTANDITDSGGAATCANGPTFVVVATSGTLNVINAAGTGVTTATLSTTLPAVRF